MSNSVFLNPLEQDLVELDRHLLAIIKRYQHVEQRLTEQQLGSVGETVRARLQKLEAEHEDFRRSLKARDLLPHGPEADLEDIKRGFASLRAWIESDQTQALLTWLIETEQAWQETLSNFRSNELKDSQIKPLYESALASIDALKKHQDED